MKKTLLAMAVLSAAGMASAEVKLSGDITAAAVAGGVNVDSPRMEVLEFGSELNLDVTEDLGNGITAYAHAEFEFNEHAKDGFGISFDNDGANPVLVGTNTGGFSIDDARIGLKGTFGDFSVGDVSSGCDSVLVGGTNSEFEFGDFASCNDANGAAQGFLYKNTFGPVSGAVSYEPSNNKNFGTDEYSVGFAMEYGPVAGSIGYTNQEGSNSAGVVTDADNLTVGLEGSFAGFTLGAQYLNADYDEGGQIDSWEVNAIYNLPNGAVYAEYGSTDEDTIDNETGLLMDDNDGYIVGYEHKLSARTIVWAEVGERDNHVDTSYHVGMKHSF